MKLLLHIGAGKCGSTAIQSYLSTNVEALRRIGVLVPGTELDLQSPMHGQQAFFYQSLVTEYNTTFLQRQNALPGSAKLLKEKILYLKELMLREGAHTLVLSAENLCNESAFADLFSFCLDEFDCEIILYIRRQDDYLISAWTQWYLKLYDSFADYINGHILIDANWLALAEPWRKVFGAERMKVRLYDREKLFGSDVVTDFVQVTGLPDEGCVYETEGAVNPSVNDTVAELASQVKDVFSSVHDGEFYNVMSEMIGPRALKRDSRSSIASLEERLRIYVAYAPSNAEVQRLYFPDQDLAQPLFQPPSADEVLCLSSEERMRRQIALLTRAVFAAGKKLQAHGL